MDWAWQLSDQWSMSGIVNYVRGKRDDIEDELYRIAPANTSMLQWLLDKRVDPHAADDRERRPIDHARPAARRRVTYHDAQAYPKYIVEFRVADSTKMVDLM